MLVKHSINEPELTSNHQGSNDNEDDGQQLEQGEWMVT
jgi:hypothetical protein